jgi:hypothetical protein
LARLLDAALTCVNPAALLDHRQATQATMPAQPQAVLLRFCYGERSPHEVDRCVLLLRRDSYARKEHHSPARALRPDLPRSAYLTTAGFLLRSWAREKPRYAGALYRGLCRRAALGDAASNKAQSIALLANDAVEGGCLKALWPQRREPLHKAIREQRGLTRFAGPEAFAMALRLPTTTKRRSLVRVETRR